ARLMNLPRTSLTTAMASVVSLAAQAIFSLVMLQFFGPKDVGEFSVVSQIAFFWITLALAQSPLSLLADVHRPPGLALRMALGASVLRLVVLMPLAWMAVNLAEISPKPVVFGWVLALAMLQLGWYLAQPFTLRTGSARSIAWVRAAPPLVALVVAGAMGHRWPQVGGTGLLLAAVSGYAVGALWLLPARRKRADRAGVTNLPDVSAQADRRSMALRLAHTAADALTGVAIVMLWQLNHGAAAAGFLAVLLRIFGFVPTLIHVSWAQVLLAQGLHQHASPLWVGLAGAMGTAILGLACAGAVKFGWFASSWEGLLPYVIPLVLWQGAACLLAASSHLPFQKDRASAFSGFAIGFDMLQIVVLCAPLALGLSWEPATHAWWLSGVSAIGLTGLSYWLLRPKH
ncbi:MAG TPA: hypothetical protein PK034_12240, partial [Rugosibacter sp.]|nr:hypothetical protein [Rugosibacter sp.]